MKDERLHIEELLRRFMNSETTLDEERLLGDWLRTHEVDDTLKPYQRMFAAFDAGLPLSASGAVRQVSPFSDTAREESKRRHMVWWHWAAAAVIAGLLALGGIWLAKRPAAPTEQLPIVAKDTPKAPIDTIAKNEDIKPILAKNRQDVGKPATNIVTTNKESVKEKSKVKVSSKQDSIEVVRTAGDLELAESEYLAEQQELEQQLQELRQQRLAQKSGWHYTTLPCE